MCMSKYGDGIQGRKKNYSSLYSSLVSTDRALTLGLYTIPEKNKHHTIKIYGNETWVNRPILCLKTATRDGPFTSQFHGDWFRGTFLLTGSYSILVVFMAWFYFSQTFLWFSFCIFGVSGEVVWNCNSEVFLPHLWRPLFLFSFFSSL